MKEWWRYDFDVIVMYVSENEDKNHFKHMNNQKGKGLTNASDWTRYQTLDCRWSVSDSCTNTNIPNVVNP